MASTHVTTEVRGAVLWVAMNRPAKKNALTMDMYDDLSAAFKRAGDEEGIRALVITGAPGVFTAGNDIGDFMRGAAAGGDSPVLRFLQVLSTFRKVLIAAVDGPAVGLGTTMLLHCDLVVATERAMFTMPFTKLGLVPEAGATLLLPARVGRSRASAWLLLGRPFDAAEALDAGLVYQVVAPDELERAVTALADEVAALPRTAIEQTKALMLAAQGDAVQATMAREVVLFMERLGSSEAMEAMAAFMTKR